MARVVPFHPSLQPSGIAVAPRAGSIVCTATAVGAVLSVLSFVGSAAVAAGKYMESTFVAWAEARRAREEDRKLWALALNDSRLMADLVALQQHVDAPTR